MLTFILTFKPLFTLLLDDGFVGSVLVLLVSDGFVLVHHVDGHLRLGLLAGRARRPLAPGQGGQLLQRVLDGRLHPLGGRGLGLGLVLDDARGQRRRRVRGRGRGGGRHALQLVEVLRGPAVQLRGGGGQGQGRGEAHLGPILREHAARLRGLGGLYGDIMNSLEEEIKFAGLCTIIRLQSYTPGCAGTYCWKS